LNQIIHAKDKALLRNAIPAFLNGTGLFVDLCVHNDRRIRTACMHTVREYVVVGLRRAFSNQLLESTNMNTTNDSYDNADESGASQKRIVITPCLAMLLVLCDPVSEVSKAAENAFSEIFSPRPLTSSPASPGSPVSSSFPPMNYSDPELLKLETMSLSAPETIPRLIRLMSLSSAQVSDMRSASIEEAEERIERIHISALDLLSLFVSLSNHDKIDDSDASGRQRRELSISIQTILFRSHLATDAYAVLARHLESKSPSIRRSSYRLVSNLCRFSPLVLAKEQTLTTNLIIPSRGEREEFLAPVRIPAAELCSLFLNCCVSEKASQAQTLAYETVRIFLQTFPLIFGYSSLDLESEEFISSIADSKLTPTSKNDNALANLKLLDELPPIVDLRKVFWSKLIEQLKRSCYGSGEAVYPYLLSILVLFPSQMLLIPFNIQSKAPKGNVPQQGMVSRVLLHIIGGLRNQASEESLTHQGQLCAVQAFCDISVLSLAVATRTSKDSQVFESSIYVEQQVFGLFAALLSSILLDNSAPENERADFIQKIVSSALVDNAIESALAAIQELGYLESTSANNTFRVSLGRGIRDCISSGLVKVLKQLEDITRRRAMTGKSASRISSVLTSLWQCIESSLIFCMTNSPSLCKRVISSLIAEEVNSERFTVCMRSISEVLFRRIDGELKTSVSNPQEIIELLRALLLFSGKEYQYIHISPCLWLEIASSLTLSTSSMEIVDIVTELTVSALQKNSCSDEEAFFQSLRSVISRKAVDFISKTASIEEILPLLRPRIHPLASFLTSTSNMMKTGRFALPSSLDKALGDVCNGIFKSLSFEVINSRERSSIAMKVLAEMKAVGCLTKFDQSQINKNAVESATKAFQDILITDVVSSCNDSCLTLVVGWYTLRSNLCDDVASVSELIQIWRVESLLLYSQASPNISQTSSDLISSISSIRCREVERLASSPTLLSETLIAVEGVIREEVSHLEIPNNSQARFNAKSAAAFLSNIFCFPGINWKELSFRLNLWSFAGRDDYVVFISWLLVLNKVKVFDVADTVVPSISLSQDQVTTHDIISSRFALLLLTNSIRVIYSELSKAISNNDFQLSQDAYMILSELNDTAGGDVLLVEEALREALTSTDILSHPRKDLFQAAKICLIASLKCIQETYVRDELNWITDPWELLANRCLIHQGKWQSSSAEGPFMKVDLSERTTFYQSSLITLCAGGLADGSKSDFIFFSVDRIASIGRASSRLHALLASDAQVEDLTPMKDIFPSPHPIICGVVCAETLRNTIISFMNLKTDLDRKRSFRHVLTLIAATKSCWARRHVNLYPLLKGEAASCECAALLLLRVIDSTLEFVCSNFFKMSFDIRVALGGLLDSCVLPSHTLPWLRDIAEGRALTKEIVKNVMTFSTEKWTPESSNDVKRTENISPDVSTNTLNNAIRTPSQPDVSLANTFTSAVGTLFRVGASFVGSVFSDTQLNVTTAPAVIDTDPPPVSLQTSGDPSREHIDKDKDEIQSDAENPEKRLFAAHFFFPDDVIRQVIIKNIDDGELNHIITFTSEDEDLLTYDEYDHIDNDSSYEKDEDDDDDDGDDDDGDNHDKTLQVKKSNSRLWLQKSSMLHYGLSLLPKHVSDCMNDKGTAGRLELIFYEICSAFEGEGSSAPSISAYQDADYMLRCALRAFLILERSVNERMFRCLSLYLSSEETNIDGIVLKGASFPRILEACMKLFLGLDDLFSGGGVGSVFQNPPALEMALNIIEESSFPPSMLSDVETARIRGAKIIILSMLFMIRFAAVAPSKFQEAFFSFPKGIKSDADRFISRYITTRIVEAHLTDAHKFASESRAIEASSKRPTSLDIPSLVALGCSNDDLSFISKQILSPELCTFAGAGLPFRPTMNISSFLHGFQQSPSSSSTSRTDDVEFTIRGIRSSREIVGVYKVGEATVSAVISFPPSYPLKKVNVSLDQRMGLTDSQSKRLKLQLSKLISNHGSSMASVFTVLKQTVDSILRGVEPCPVCYCVLDTDSRLPRLSCTTCSNKYHKSCLMKWFSKAVEATCPLCRQKWQGYQR
jgi:hypothetical protein